MSVKKCAFLLPNMLLGIIVVCLLTVQFASAEPEVAPQFYCINVHAQVAPCAGDIRPKGFESEQAAYVRYVNRINETGWSELELVTNSQLSDETQAYYAGFLEGYLTHHLIDSFRRSNSLGTNDDMTSPLCKQYGGFIHRNLNYTVGEINKWSHQETEAGKYWHEVALTLYQLAGIDDGHLMAQKKIDASASKPHFDLNPCGSFLLNSLDEVDDIDLYDDSHLKEMEAQDRITKCSAIVKWLPDKGEILVAHDTWGHYTTMLRVLKRYSFNFNTSQAKSVAMSSYPGLVYSNDDFYITSQNMIVQETSIATYNHSLYRGTSAHGIVMEFIRNAVANRLASSGTEWAHAFGQHNSGSYNNQFMLVDLKHLKQSGNLSAATIEPGFLTILEQQPNIIHFEDKTDHLRQTGYWASYNIPYFPDVYVQSGFLARFQQYGNHYSYDLTPRAQIFKRDQGKVHDIATLHHLMRYNDFRHDPLARCNCTPPYSAEYAIAERSDLNDPNGHYQLHAQGFNPTGAIDAKLTSAKLARNMEFVAESGPSHQEQPVFDWATFPDKSVHHYDQPQVWQFKPVITRWEQPNKDGFPYFEFDF